MKEHPSFAMELELEEPSQDPLANPSDPPSTSRPLQKSERGFSRPAATGDDNNVVIETKNGEQRSMEEILTLLRQTKQIDLNDELSDPIEWTVRKVFPLPEVYYWDLLEGQPDEVTKEIPWKIRWWHRLVGSLDRTSHIVNRWVAQPIAGTLGITESRFSYVTDHMTDEELEEAKRVAREKSRRQLQQQQEPSSETSINNTNIPSNSGEDII